jgi:hypothetical protein
MKKTIITGSVFMLLAAMANAQAPVGLDSIIVEKYYVSDANDQSLSNSLGGGDLPVNSVTYRIFAALKPGYKFQAAYGVDVTPHTAPSTVTTGDHELRIQTSTLFFNNEDRGDVSPTYSKTQAADNSVMLDSWLSVGAVCDNNVGIMKSEDDGVATVMNNDGLLTNTHPEAGIPLTLQDGFLMGSPMTVTPVGITTEIGMFNDQNDGTNGPVFSTYNGSWAALGGAAGAGSYNRVLIGQMTTDGVFSFKLNIQLGTPTPGGVENWVAENPVGNEGTHPSLIYMDSLHATSIKDVKNATAANFGVFPNPATSVVTLDINPSKSSADNSYTVYSIDGKMVASKNIGQIQTRTQTQIDISGFQPGLYFVELSQDGVKSTKKFVKN